MLQGTDRRRSPPGRQGGHAGAGLKHTARSRGALGVPTGRYRQTAPLDEVAAGLQRQPEWEVRPAHGGLHSWFIHAHAEPLCKLLIGQRQLQRLWTHHYYNPCRGDKQMEAKSADISRLQISFGVDLSL